MIEFVAFCKTVAVNIFWVLAAGIMVFTLLMLVIALLSSLLNNPEKKNEE